MNGAAVDTHPTHECLGLAALLRRSLSGVDLTPLYQSLLQRAENDPNDACALLDASLILQFRGSPDNALRLQQEALKLQRCFRLPAKQPVTLRVLALVAPGPVMANVPIECLLEDSDVELTLCYAAPDGPVPSACPDHDVLFVAIGEWEANRPLLDSWSARLATWPKPVLIDPRAIPRVARDTAARLLHGRPGVVMPPTRRIARQALQLAARGIAHADALASVGFPLLLRPVDSHAGHDLFKIDDRAQLLDKLAAMAGAEFFVTPFVDYRSADGWFRKYRVILIDGKPFGCHMGISSHWMIHYANAGMAESADKRREEAQFLAGFEQEFAARHATALGEIHRALGLDYLGIDCAETPDGRLLVFEVDHAMVVHAMDPVDLFPYKQPAMRKVFDAFRQMLLKASMRAAPSLA